MKNAREIRIIDPYTIRIVLDQPNALLLNNIVMGPIAGWVIGAPKHMEQIGWEEFLRRPIGTGPYMVEGEVKDYRKMPEGQVYATLVANPDYWKKGHPKIQKIAFVKYSSEEALRAVIEGRVDLVTNMIPKDTLKVAESTRSKVVKGREDIRVTVGSLNMLSPHTFPLRSVLVRKALNYAVNKEELLRYAFKGNAVKMKGVLTEKSGVDLSGTNAYDWDIAKARELLKEAGYAEGFKMKVSYHEKDYLIARFLQRFYALLKIEVEITPGDWEWGERHILYPNTREGYSWEDENWWLWLQSQAAYTPETMGLLLPSIFYSRAPWKTFGDWLALPLDGMYNELLRTKNRHERFQIYKKANEYIADQALLVFTMAPMTLYGVNKGLNFIPQVSWFLYLDYASVTDDHWSIQGK